MCKKLCSILLTTFILFSCSDNSTEPKDEEIFGTYKLVEMTKDTINFYDVGVKLSMELKSDSSFSGTMFLPDTLGLTEKDEGDKTYTFDGKFRVKSKILNFETDTDIFIKDTGWLIDGNKLLTYYYAHIVLQKE